MPNLEIENNCTDYNSCNRADSCTIEDVELPNNVQDTINIIIDKEGYKSYELCKRQFSTDGGNYLGVLYEVDVKGITNNGEKQTNVFMKCILENGNVKILSITEAYKRELYFYNKISKVFNELENEANIPLEERFKMPKNYSGPSQEVIALDNLVKKGFKTGKRMEVMSLKFAEIAMRQLATFHALSYAIQEKRPEYFDKNIKSMKHLFPFNDDWKTSFTNFFEISIKHLEGDIRMKLDKEIPILIEKVISYFRDNTSEGCCMCHADYRINNLMMKEENGEVIDIVPVDYQLLYYGSPLNDIFFFFYTGTDQEFRRKHLEYLKGLYYDTLTKVLKYFDLNVEKIFSRKEFERQFKERRDFGLAVALFSPAFIFADDDDVMDLSKDEVSSKSVRLHKSHEERLRGVIEEFTDLGFL